MFVLRKYEKMLPRQKVEFTLKVIAGRLHFILYRLTCRKMAENPEEPSFAVEVDDCNAAVRPEVFSGLSKICYTVFQVMVGIASKDQVYSVSGNEWVMMLGTNDLDIPVTTFAGLFFHIFVHPRINIHGVYFPRRANRICNAEGEVATA